MKLYYDLLNSLCSDFINKTINLIKVGLDGYF